MLNVYFQFFGLLDIILLTVVYFTKNAFKSTENKVYSGLIITSFIGQILHILSYVTIYNMEVIPTINWLVTKLYLVYLVVWVSLIFMYICIITYKYSKDKKTSLKIKKTILYVSLIDIAIVFLIFMIPTYCYREGSVIYTYGSSINLIYSISIIYITLAILLFIKYKKDITKSGLKKYLPLFVFILIGSIAMVIQFINPSLLLMTSCETFITFLMYFTIENPDIKMLREFHKQRELANESNEEKTSFLFNMSNQIKEPILAISNISGEALLEDNMEEVKDDLRRIKSSSNELLQLVNDVLDISDIEKRKIGIRGSKYNVYHLFEVLNKNFSKNVNKKVEYRFHFDKSIPEYLYGDSIRIKQVMNILLENALEYTNEGFIEVNVNSIIKHDVCRLIITVEDSGIGMSADEIKHLFDKEKIYSDELLKEVDDTKNNLGVLKSIINLMNGNILVNSEIGKGSKFTIIIDQKVKEEKTKIIETVEKYEEMYENKEKILLVINHKELSKKINKMFKKDTYEIEEVTGGQACLEKIRKNEKFDLIIMEEDLEKLSSEDTLIKLKDTSGYKIPVILISDNKGFGAKEMYQEKGFKDVLFLPLKKEEVLKQVEEYIKD